MIQNAPTNLTRRDALHAAWRSEVEQHRQMQRTARRWAGLRGMCVLCLALMGADIARQELGLALPVQQPATHAGMTADSMADYLNARRAALIAAQE